MSGISKLKITETNTAKNTANKYIFFAVTVFILISASSVASADPWWNTSWSYVRPITITNSSALSDYQILINITNTTNMNTTGQDIRFTYDDNTTVLSYWIESWAVNNAQIWVKTNQSLINMWYSNPSATNTSNGTAIFLSYLDCNGAALDPGFTAYTAGPASTSVANGMCNINSTGASSTAKIRSDNTFAPPYRLVIKNSVVFSSAWSVTIVGLSNTIVSAGSYPDQWSITGGNATHIRNGDGFTTRNYDIDTTIPIGDKNMRRWEIYGNSSVMTAWRDNILPKNISTTNIPNNALPFSASAHSEASNFEPNSVLIDYMFIAKYMSSEPTVSISAEQSQPPNNTAPTITLSAPVDGSWSISRTISHQFTPSDDLGFINCSVWNNATGVWGLDQTNTSAITNDSTNTIQVTYPADGDYLWSVKCYDNGNPSLSNFSIINRTIRVDSIDPSVSITSPESDGTWFNIAPDLTANCSDINFANLTINHTSYTATKTSTPATWNNISSVSQGTNSFRMTCSDAGGNTGTADRSFNFDNIASTTSINDTSSDWRNQMISFSLSCLDLTSGCNATVYCIDTTNSCVPNLAYSAPIAVSSEGISYIRYRSSDLSGNTETTQSQTYKIDTTPPTLVSYSPAAGAIEIDQNNTIKLSFNEDMNQSAFTGVTLKDPNNTNIPLTLQSYDNTTHIIIFSPSNVLDNNKVYTVNVSGLKDLAGNALSDTSWVFTTATSYNIPLSKTNASGWNLISFPVVPTNTSIEAVLSNVTGNIVVVWTYNGTDWLMYSPGGPSNTLNDMTTGYGYWIKYNNSESKSITGSGSLLLEGNFVPPSRTLVEGWNLIGYYQKGNANGIQAKCALYTLTPDITDWTQAWWQSPVMGYDNTGKAFTEVLYNDVMTPGHGYWILMKSSHVYAPGMGAKNATTTDCI